MHPWSLGSSSSATTIYGLVERAEGNTCLLGLSPPPGAGNESTPRSLAPLFRYPGGKRAEIKHYADFIPQSGDFNLYVEPFVGGGATYFHLNHPGANVIADVNPQVVNFYEQVQAGRGQRLAALVEQYPNIEANYLFVRDAFVTAGVPLLEAFRFYYLRQTCFRGIDQYDRWGRFNTGWNRTANGRVPSCSRLLDPSYASLLGRSHVRLASFEDTIAEHCDSPDAFVFLDPPYVGFDHYPGARVQGEEQFGRREHETLFGLFEESRARCLLIVADSPLMRELYRGYVRAAYAKNYSMKRNRQVARSTHLIITNYL
jgi:DNA adenine methylase